MKKLVLSVALVSGIGLIQARAQGVVGKIIDDLKENARTVHQINKENLAAEKEAYQEMFPDAVKFWQAKGFKNKTKVVAESIKEGCREYSEKERERRDQIKSFESYKDLLEKQRETREAMIGRNS
jgi:hypothetical protein